MSARAVWRLAPIAAALLAGCAAVGPDYQRPVVALPAQYPQAPAGETAPLPDAWWTIYGDPQLDQLVERALAANADIAQAAARVELAEAQLREAGGALVPTVNATAAGSRARSSGQARGNPTGRPITGNDFSLGLNTSFEIDFWGKLRRATEAARAELLASQAARETVRLTIAGAVAQSWFALRALDAQVDATALTLKSREEGVRLFDLRLKAGTGSRLESDQAEILRADSAVLLRDLQRQRALAQSQLAVLTAEPGIVLPPASLRADTLPPLPPPGLPSSLLERRPDVRRAEQLLVSANAQIGVARAAMFPTLSLTGALGQESTALSMLLDGPARFWSLGFGLSLPLFDGGRNAARTDQAIARQHAAVGAYQSAVATAFKDVADALAAVRAARESAADLAARDTAAQRALKLAKARFDAGYSGYLELLDAQRTATAAALESVRNRQAQLNASVDLIKALGGSWAGGAAPR